MLLRLLSKIKYRGVAMVEYAVLLAFVCVVSAVFFDDGGIEKGIEGSINKVLAIFDQNTKEKYTNYSMIANHILSFNSGKFAEVDNEYGQRTNCTSNIPLGGPGTYRFTIDFAAMKEYLGQNGIDVTEQQVKDYVGGLSLGIWGVNEKGTLVENRFQKNTGADEGITVYTENNKDSTDPAKINRGGDSGGLWLGYHTTSNVDDKVNYYQLTTTKTDGNASVRYSVIHQSEEDATAKIDYDKALVNAGIKITKIQ